MGVAIHDWSRKRGKLLTLALVVVPPTVLSGPARADAPTHRFQIDSAKTYKTDCGTVHHRLVCTVACQMKGTLTNLGASSPQTIEVIFGYKHRHIPGAKLVFQFEPPVRQQTDDALGVTCRELVIQSVKIRCPFARGERCSGFVNVRINERKSSPRINAQTVSD